MKRVYGLFAAMLVSASQPCIAQELQAVGELVLVDGNGDVVGTMFGSDYVYLSHGSDPAAVLRVSRNDSGITLRDGTNFYYESDDCTGQAYILASEQSYSPVLPLAHVGMEPERVVYVVDLQDVRSIVTGSDLSTAGCQTDGPSRQDAFVPIPITDLSTKSPPPYSVLPRKTAACCGDCNGSGNVTVDEIVTTVDKALRGCSR